MISGFWGGRRYPVASIAVQALCLLLLGIYIFFRILTKPSYSIAMLLDLGASGVFTLLAIFMVQGFIRGVRAEAEAEINRIRLREISAMIDMLRAQRHDFLNHLQVLYGLIQIGRIEVIKDYINQVNQEMRETSRLISSLRMRPEVAGLIMRKMAQADADGISFTLDLRTDLALLAVPPLDFSRIIGNLLDNAINAAKTVPPEERAIRLEMAEDEDCYKVRVTNYRPLIPESLMKSVFEKGFTTKRGKGEGLGLYIVKTLAEKHGGNVYLTCSEGTGTTFEVLFPKALLHEFVQRIPHSDGIAR